MLCVFHGLFYNKLKNIVCLEACLKHTETLNAILFQRRDNNLTKNERYIPDLFIQKKSILVFSYRVLQEFYAASHLYTKEQKKEDLRWVSKTRSPWQNK